MSEKDAEEAGSQVDDLKPCWDGTGVTKVPEPQGDRTGLHAFPKIPEMLDQELEFQQACDGKAQALGLHQGGSGVGEGG